MATVTTDRDDPSRYCGAAKRQGTGNCTHIAGWGTDHVGAGKCKLHGGSTRNHSRSAHLQLAEKRARTVLGNIGDHSTPVTDPLAELARLAGDAVAWKDFCAAAIANIKQMAYAGRTGEQIKGEVQLFTQAMTICNQVITNMAKVNLDERLVRIEEEKAALIITALNKALAISGVRGNQKTAVQQAFAHNLRAVS